MSQKVKIYFKNNLIYIHFKTKTKY